jgi:L-amino acid N-acyltransferase YncA
MSAADAGAGGPAMAARPGTSRVRVARPDDAAGILAIYAPIVRDTVISFEFEPPTIEIMRERVVSTLPRWPWLVCERDGALLGYVYASSHRERAAYQWCVEVAAYVAASARRTGVARALYQALFAMLAAQGFVNAYAGITLPNAASVGLHESLGFRRLGSYEHIGHKLGAWHDVGWWALPLCDLPRDPRPPILFAHLRETAPCQEALSLAQAALQP